MSSAETMVRVTAAAEWWDAEEEAGRALYRADVHEHSTVAGALRVEVAFPHAPTRGTPR